MKIMHMPFTFHPDKVGGTEVYVEQLSRELQTKGNDILIAAPSEQTTTYSYEGMSVYRYATASDGDIRDIYGEGDQQAATQLATILDETHPDIIHMHAFTKGVSLLHLREAQQRSIPVVFTYHTPTVSCPRGTLLRWNETVCDGYLDLNRCTACVLHKLGMSRTASKLIGKTPVGAGKMLGKAGLSGGGFTALRMRELIDLRISTTQHLFEEVDQIVVLCSWIKDLLLLNDVPESKMIVSRHGITVPDNLTLRTAQSDTERLKVIYIGRIHPTKGLDVVIKALGQIPDANIQLDIYGVLQDGVGGYHQQISEMAERDQRIVFHDPVPHAEVIPLLSQYDAIVVPSQILETGPLVVLEAFAAGIPVIGSNLGGIAELVTHEQDGLLVRAEDPNAWSQAFEMLVMDQSALEALQHNVRPPRTMSQVTNDMLSVYDTVLNRHKSH